MANYRNFSKAHRWIYLKTKGRIGSSINGIPMLLLTTVGRKSGTERTTPLSYYPYGNDCVVVASNGGQEKPPGWWFNLQSNAVATVRAGKKVSQRKAILAEGKEREELWGHLTNLVSQFEGYDASTERELPVVILREIDQ